jgi:phytoene dehydrogenase-like protein
MYDTIIIGAGMSGLAAGIRLAHYEQRVCILERHHVIGGLNSYYRRDGRHFDVGLHAMTNFAVKGTRGGVLGRALRQLRLAWDELALRPQLGSAVRFPRTTLRFTNDFELLLSEVRREFPREVDGVRRLAGSLCDYERFADPDNLHSARARVSEHVADPLLREMLFCPILFYGGTTEHDVSFGSFSVLFRSIFLEGLARPLAGVRLLLTKLLRKFRELGGELRLRAGVKRLVVRDGAIDRVILDDGSEITGRRVLSSAGWKETVRMCDAPTSPIESSRLSFVESISVLDAPPRDLGMKETIVFFNDSERFAYERPHEPVDLRSGTICCPSNFDYDEPSQENQVRVSCLANYDRWAALDDQRYRVAKLRWYDRMADSAVRFMPDFRRRVIDTEMFTPVTIQRFTGHDAGAIYGAAEKRYDGTTHLKNLYVCGNDQGLVGIMGAIISGITVANQHLLK